MITRPAPVPAPIGRRANEDLTPLNQPAAEAVHDSVLNPSPGRSRKQSEAEHVRHQARSQEQSATGRPGMRPRAKSS
jgi:hypothetical protein